MKLLGLILSLLAAILLFMLAGCAGTTIRTPDGAVMRTTSDAKRFLYERNGVRLEIENLDNSEPTRAYGEARSRYIEAIGAAAAGIGIGGAL